MLSERRTYTIGEIADELQVSVGWLRIGERLGALPLARRTPAGWRYYTAEDLERLRRLGVGQRKKQLKERARERA
jgi:DNA-binding transcriptional MerR regulator